MYNIHSYFSFGYDLILHQQFKLHASLCENFDSYWHNNHISCTCSVGSKIDPSFVSSDMGEELISFLYACECMPSFPFPFLSWYVIRTLDFPQVEYHEVFGVL